MATLAYNQGQGQGQGNGGGNQQIDRNQKTETNKDGSNDLSNPPCFLMSSDRQESTCSTTTAATRQTLDSQGTPVFNNGNNLAFGGNYSMAQANITVQNFLQSQKQLQQQPQQTEQLHQQNQQQQSQQGQQQMPQQPEKQLQEQQKQHQQQQQTSQPQQDDAATLVMRNQLQLMKQMQFFSQMNQLNNAVCQNPNGAEGQQISPAQKHNSAVSTRSQDLDGVEDGKCYDDACSTGSGGTQIGNNEAEESTAANAAKCWQQMQQFQQMQGQMQWNTAQQQEQQQLQM
eukprot:TRINITY_DN24722_c0_g1_i1.p1 TRINITY_DN24722_c0_g1~~TRINITY_DN24722_c0_g1_i1.p1  ORF type:complete len:305 (+),score=83.37 TRINITY_DN24722_c0_g1_i1:59-916(+)